MRPPAAPKTGTGVANGALKVLGWVSMVLLLGGDEGQWQRDQAEEVAIDQPVNRRTNRDDQYLTYITYQLRNPNTGKIYAGRASGYGTPRQILNARLRNHHKIREGYTEIIGNDVDKTAKAQMEWKVRHDDPAYQAIRGREQQLIDRNGRAYRDRDQNGNPGTSGNTFRGVAKNVREGYIYWAQSNHFFGNIAPYTGDPRYIP